ncbi:hypothetical protein R3P38DRAFT_3269515 [Favolaschia claudopus]|uniref:Uncharacterized protein n=1 Tax=Favolaschia claudopus TaxID=2862362 RepID=A0AAW0BFM2_9AGAR
MPIDVPRAGPEAKARPRRIKQRVQLPSLKAFIFVAVLPLRRAAALLRSHHVSSSCEGFGCRQANPRPRRVTQRILPLLIKSFDAVIVSDAPRSGANTFDYTAFAGRLLLPAGKYTRPTSQAASSIGIRSSSSVLAPRSGAIGLSGRISVPPAPFWSAQHVTEVGYVGRKRRNFNLGFQIQIFAIPQATISAPNEPKKSPLRGNQPPSSSSPTNTILIHERPPSEHLSVRYHPHSAHLYTNSNYPELFSPAARASSSSSTPNTPNWKFEISRSRERGFQSLGIQGTPGLAGAGSLAATGISKISPTAPGPEKWQYIFYILGAVTMAWSFIILFFLPDSPASARFLKPEMRVLAVQRVAANQLGIKNKKFKTEQVWVAVKDIKIWILFSSVFAAAIPNGVVSNFSSVIMYAFLLLFGSVNLRAPLHSKDMGFSTTKTTVLKSVGDITQIVALVVGGVITLNFNNTRLLASTGANIICVVSAACMAYLPRHLVWQRLVSFWLVNCQSVGFAASLVMVSSNMGGYTHRQDATAGLLAGYTIKLSPSKRYSCADVSSMFTINKRRDNKYGEPDVAAAKEAGMQDKTEYENKLTAHYSTIRRIRPPPCITHLLIDLTTSLRLHDDSPVSPPAYAFTRDCATLTALTTTPRLPHLIRLLRRRLCARLNASPASPLNATLVVLSPPNATPTLPTVPIHSAASPLLKTQTHQPLTQSPRDTPPSPSPPLPRPSSTPPSASSSAAAVVSANTDIYVPAEKYTELCSTLPSLSRSPLTTPTPRFFLSHSNAPAAAAQAVNRLAPAT